MLMREGTLERDYIIDLDADFDTICDVIKKRAEISKKEAEQALDNEYAVTIYVSEQSGRVSSKTMANMFLQAQSKFSVLSGELNNFLDKSLVNFITELLLNVKSVSVDIFCGTNPKRNEDGFPLIDSLKVNPALSDIVSLYYDKHKVAQSILKYHCIVVDGGSFIVLEDKHEHDTEGSERRFLFIQNDFELGDMLLRKLNVLKQAINTKNNYDEIVQNSLIA